MSKLIYKLVFLCFIFSPSVSHSTIIENFDAFQQNDKLALRDIDTGLVWLDFGVNNGESINSVVNNLNGLYAGWRLPTEAEVINLWEKLATSDLTNIFDFWGANKTPTDHLPYLSWGYFIDDEGYLGAAYIKEVPASSPPFSAGTYYGNSKIVTGIEKKIIDIKYDGSDYYLFELDGAAEISTLLVRRSIVSESSIFSLFCICFFVLLVRFRLKKSYFIFNGLH
jgi:hypothetical protein